MSKISTIAFCFHFLSLSFSKIQNSWCFIKYSIQYLNKSPFTICYTIYVCYMSAHLMIQRSFSTFGFVKGIVSNILSRKTYIQIPIVLISVDAKNLQNGKLSNKFSFCHDAGISASSSSYFFCCHSSYICTYLLYTRNVVKFIL